MKTILNIKDLYEIAAFIIDKGFDEVPLEITIPVYTRERMNRINQEFNTNEHMNPTDGNIQDDVDEINVTVLGLNFKYRLTELPNGQENFSMVEEKEQELENN